MAFPTTSVIDNFTGANGSISGRVASPGGQTWGSALYFGSSAAQITSNAIATINGTTQTAGIAVAYGRNCEVFATANASAMEETYLFLRLSQVTIIETYTGSWFMDVINTGYRIISDHTADFTGQPVIHNGSAGRVAWVGGNLALGDKFGFSLEEVSGGTIARAYRTLSGVWGEDRNATLAGSRITAAGFIGFRLAGTGANNSAIMDDFGGGTMVPQTTASMAWVTA